MTRAGGLDLDLGADLKAHRTPGVTHDRAPDDTAHRPAMPYDAQVLDGPLPLVPSGGASPRQQ